MQFLDSIELAWYSYLSIVLQYCKTIFFMKSCRKKHNLVDENYLSFLYLTDQLFLLWKQYNWIFFLQKTLIDREKGRMMKEDKK
jgi:hypothetical protein